MSTKNKQQRVQDGVEVLGRNLDSPAEFVVCWTRDGSLDGTGPDTGGTGQALRIAAHHGVRVFNLALKEHREISVDWLST